MATTTDRDPSKKETYGEPLKKRKFCCRIGSRSFRTSFAIFFDKLITWEPNTNLDRKRHCKMKKKKTVKNTAFLAPSSHCCNNEFQTQLPQNEEPKQTTSSLERSGRELSR